MQSSNYTRTQSGPRKCRKKSNSVSSLLKYGPNLPLAVMPSYSKLAQHYKHQPWQEGDTQGRREACNGGEQGPKIKNTSQTWLWRSSHRGQKIAQH
jgi:hypothetical protein